MLILVPKWPILRQNFKIWAIFTSKMERFWIFFDRNDQFTNLCIWVLTFHETFPKIFFKKWGGVNIETTMRVMHLFQALNFLWIQRTETLFVFWNNWRFRRFGFLDVFDELLSLKWDIRDNVLTYMDAIYRNFAEP